MIDIGANLCHDSFDDDRNAVLARALAAEVNGIVVTGSCAHSSPAAADLAAAHPGRLWATAGVHPHHAADYDASTDALIRSLADHPSIVAIGETGLDYFRNISPPADQRRAFLAHLEIAADTGLPLFLHQRDAHDDFIEIFDRYRERLGRAVVHCFTGTGDELDACIERDLYIGITGWICDERRGQHLHDIVGRIPTDRLLIETDAPYLLPRSLVPKPATRRNEPMHLPEVARTVAEARGESIDAVIAATTANAERFFGITVSAS